jgi:hypothetical protein
MSELKETARFGFADAFHQLEWTACQSLAAGSWKDTCERLIPQMQNGDQLTISANAAAIDTTELCHDATNLGS